MKSENSLPTSGSQSSVLFLSGDLMFASRVRGAAEAAGLQFRLGGSLPENDLDSIQTVIIDLSTCGSLIPDVVQQVTEKLPAARLIAYGPHVQAAKLTAARQAGVPTVLTRGQFDSVLSSLFQR